ncbi:MAG: glycine cleavage system protein T, partial [Actinobacteria bacterium]|nr:glycine cleavage system protein T [Actinomycetota bacterium]
ETEQGPAKRLVLLEVDAADADASKENGIWIDDRLVGNVTSGAYGHHVGKSLALAYLDSDVVEAPRELTVYVIGDPRPARLLPDMPYDPNGSRLRS